MRLDPSQVVDMRALDAVPGPMDVHFDPRGHVNEWYRGANAGGISWNPALWTMNPGPMNTGHRTPLHVLLAQFLQGGRG